MVASTDVKWYTFTNTNAPQLSNAFGVMVDLLDACLVNGFGSQTISTMTASGTTVTVTFGTAHNFLQYQVIEIAGATPSAYNGQFRILTVPNSTSFTFQLSSTPSASTATGTMTCKLPALGWEKSFSGTQKAAYRSLNTLLTARPYLRVDNSQDAVYTSAYAKYAKVGIVETMTDVDTMSGVQAPYDGASPTKNWVGTGSGTTAINGWAKWYYAGAQEFRSSQTDNATAASGNRNWLLVGNSDWFYILPAFIASNVYALCYGFGSFKSLLNVDNVNTFLSATLNYVGANIPQLRATQTPLSASAVSLVLMQRKFDASAVYSTAAGSSVATITGGSGVGNTIAAPATQTNIPIFPVFLLETDVLRGQLNNLFWLAQQTPYTDLQVFTESGSIYIAKTVNTNSNSTGQIVLKIGEL